MRVLLAIKTLGPGGAEHLLADLVGGGDDLLEYEVAHVLAHSDTLAPLIRARGVPVHSLGATSNLDWHWLAAFRRLLVAGKGKIAALAEAFQEEEYFFPKVALNEADYQVEVVSLRKEP